MEVGKVSVLVGLVASIASIVLYVLSLRGNQKVLKAARAAYALTAVCVVVCFGRLMWLVYNHKLQYKYVFDHSDTNLTFPWNIAATWAGQEGSFLLWSFWTAVIGGLVAWKAGKWENRLMPFYVSVLTILFSILAWLSPYALIIRGTGPTDYPLDLPWPPQHGQGLNPSLQNYWMAIHPPTIFFGFASLAVPFCYALAAMIWREYDSWAPRVMPWVLMTVGTLGIGLFMGGYWAYETQGWHGFWAWDPVENASLFPWLGALGLLHGLVVQKSRGGMGRSNIFLAIIAWISFLYGTYLTRSGVLSNFSVHSFVSLASQPLVLIIVMIGGYGLLGFALLAWRWRQIPGRPISDKALSRDTAMVLAVTLMVVATVVITFGTSFPLLATKFPALKHLRLLDYDPDPLKRGAALLPIFYNKTGAAIIIPTLIIMGMVPFLAWGKTNAEKFLWKILVPWFAALGGGALIVWFVLHEAARGFNPSTGAPGFNPDTPRVLVVTIGTLGLFAAFANLALAVKLLRVKAVTMGGWLAHVGIGILFAGTVITNVYEKTTSFYLIEGMGPIKTPYGYALEYVGWSHDEKMKRAEETDDPKEAARLRDEIQMKDWWRFDHALQVRVTPMKSEEGAAHADDGIGVADESMLDKKSSFVANLPVFRHQQLMMNREEEGPTTYRWPYIHREFFRDFYMLVAEDVKRYRPSATLVPGETKTITEFEGAMPTRYEVTYKKFSMEGQPGQAGTKMVADMEVTSADGKKVAIRPALTLGGAQGLDAEPVQIPELNGAAILTPRMDAATKAMTVEFEFPDAPGRYRATMAVTNKPMVNLVWLGVIIMGLGTFCAMVRRSLEARKGALMQDAASQGEFESAENVETVPATPTNGHSATEPVAAKPKSRRPARAKG